MTRVFAIAVATLFMAAAPAIAGGPYSMDAKGGCHDSAGKFAKKDLCKVSAPQCKTGKPCGNACIPKDKACHIKG